MKSKQQPSLFWGITLLILGGLFLARNLFVDIDLVDIFLTYWPLILIFVGIKNLLPLFQRKAEKDVSITETELVNESEEK